VLDEPYGSSSDGQSGDGLAFISKTSCGPFELGAVVGVGKGCFEAVELVLFRPRAGEAGSLGVVPPGSCFGQAHGAAGGGVGGDEQQGVSDGGWGLAADGDGDPTAASRQDADQRTEGLAQALDGGGKGVGVCDAAGGEQVCVQEAALLVGLRGLLQSAGQVGDAVAGRLLRRGGWRWCVGRNVWVGPHARLRPGARRGCGWREPHRCGPQKWRGRLWPGCSARGLECLILSLWVKFQAISLCFLAMLSMAVSR